MFDKRTNRQRGSPLQLVIPMRVSRVDKTTRDLGGSEPKRWPQKNNFEISILPRNQLCKPSPLHRLLNGSNAPVRRTPNQHLSDLIDPVAVTDEPEPDIRVPRHHGGPYI